MHDGQVDVLTAHGGATGTRVAARSFQAGDGTPLWDTQLVDDPTCAESRLTVFVPTP